MVKNGSLPAGRKRIALNAFHYYPLLYKS